MVTVKAGWALRSKRPRKVDNYAVLAASAWPCAPAGFEQIIDGYMPGNPPAGDEPGDAVLPWVSFAIASVSEEKVLCVIRQDWSGYSDGSNRPVMHTKLMCVAHDELAGVPLSLRALYDAVRGRLDEWDLPDTVAGDTVEISIPPVDTARQAAVVDRYGLDRLAAIAATVTDRPVALLSGESLPDVEQRIDLLDAVAALLPAGAKSWLRAGTWTDSGAKNRLQLAFATRPRKEDVGFFLSGRPSAVPDPVAREYQRELVRLGKARRTFTVIEHLARLGTVTGRGPLAVLNGLQELDFLAAVLRRIDAGEDVPLDDIRRLDRDGDLGQGAVRVRLLRHYLKHTSVDDLDLVARNWDRALLPELVELAVREVGRDPALLTDVLVFAAERDLEEELLAGLFPRSPAAAREVSDRVRSGQAGPRLLRVISADAAASTRLVAGTLESDVDDAVRLLRWLDEAGSERAAVSPAVRAALTAGGARASAADVAELERLVPGATKNLIRACLERDWVDRRPRIVPAFVAWLASAARGGQASNEQRAWVAELRDMPKAVPVHGWVDALCLVVGEDPRHWPLDVIRGRPDDRDRYVNGFVNSARVAGQHGQGRVIQRTVREGDQTWPKGDDADYTLKFLWDLSVDSNGHEVGRQEIVTFIEHGLEQVRGLREMAGFSNWERATPSLRRVTLHTVPPDAQIAAVADAFVRAITGGANADEVVNGLGRALSVDDMEEFSFRVGDRLLITDEVGWLALTREIVRAPLRAALHSGGRAADEQVLHFAHNLCVHKMIIDLLISEIHPMVSERQWQRLVESLDRIYYFGNSRVHPDGGHQERRR